VQLNSCHAVAHVLIQSVNASYVRNLSKVPHMSATTFKQDGIAITQVMHGADAGCRRTSASKCLTALKVCAGSVQTKKNAAPA
jgi:hypothetical protein